MMRKRREHIPNFRFYILFLGIVFFWLFLWCLSFYIQVVKGDSLKKRAKSQHWKIEKVVGKRGDILSRNGDILAKSIVVKSISASPKNMTRKEKIRVASLLSKIFKRNKKHFLSKLMTDKSFVWIKRKVDDKIVCRIKDLDLPEVYLIEETKRIYPQFSMLGQLIGFVGVDNKGLEGLEYKFDSYLSGEKKEFLVLRDGLNHIVYAPDQLNTDIRGKNLLLTIDTNIQAITEIALKRSVEKFNARYGMALVVNVVSGEILAWAQYPFFNPNRYYLYSPLIWRNRIALDEFEPGSTIKPFLIASAIEMGICTPRSIFYCEKGKWNFYGHVINDTHHYGWLTVNKIIRYSSNICSGKIALKLGKKGYYKFLKKLGFGEKTNVPVPAQGRGLLRPYEKWNDFELATMGFGQGLSVTLLQLTKAYLCLANKGLLKPLVLIKKPEQPKKPPIRVFSVSTAQKILSMLMGVVELDGTGILARVDGLEIGGKTGTAQKATKFGYGNEYVASFIALVPALNPKYVIAVVVDEPKKSHYGGVVAAPVAGYIAKEIIISNSVLRMSFKKTRPLYSINNTNFEASVFREFEVMMSSSMGKPVPDVVGMDLKNAVKKLLKQGIVPRIKGNGEFVLKQKMNGRRCILFVGEKAYEKYL